MSNLQAQNAYNAYKQNSVTTASPGELTLMLYNGCLKFLHQAKKGILEKQMDVKNTNLLKAQNIIKELMSTLNMDLAVSNEMMVLYEYMNRRLVEANIKVDPLIIDEVEGLLVEFRDTWKEVIKFNRQKQFVGNQL